MMINNPTQSVVTMIPAVTSQQNQTWFSKFLKGEPKALGTVQIVIGVVTLLFGIVLLFSRDFVIYTGITFWGSFIYISAGAVSAAAANKTTPCLIIASITMNVICAVTAGIAIILLAITIAEGYYHYCYYGYGEDDNEAYTRYCQNALFMSHGISGVLLVLSLVQFIISIVVSAFGCWVTCDNRPTHIYMISNQETQNPMMQGTLVQGTVMQYTQAMPQINPPQSSAAPLGEPSFSAPLPLSNPQSSPTPPSSSAPLLDAPPPYSSVASCSQKNLRF